MSVVVRRRLECCICGVKSGEVLSMPPSPREQQMLDEFQHEHNQTCATDKNVYREGCVYPEVPVKHVGPFGSPKPPPISVLHPHGHFEYTGPYGEIEQGDTLSCPHCRCHVQVRVGWDKDWGWCSKCAMKMCGQRNCQLACIPHKLRIDNLDAGKDPLTPASPMVVAPGWMNAEGAVLLDQNTNTKETDDGGGLFGQARTSHCGESDSGDDAAFGLASGGSGDGKT